MANTKSNKTPAVAVVIRTKDRPLLLNRALTGITKQTFIDYIVVIVNDGGDTKPVEDLANKYGSLMENKPQLIHNKESVGMQNASNLAIKNSKSKYLVIHDDDDSWHPQFLQTTVQHLEENNAMGVVTSTDLIIEQIQNDKVKTISQERLFPELRFINLYNMCLENYAAPISFVFRRSVINEIGYFDESLRGFGDWDFGLRFLLKYDIDLLRGDKALAYYHQRPSSSGKSQNSVFADDQQYLVNLMTNRYLRQDIKEGKLGLGYLVNSVRKNHFDNIQLKAELKQYIDSSVNDLSQLVQQTSNNVISNHTSLFRKTARRVKRKLNNVNSKNHESKR